MFCVMSREGFGHESRYDRILWHNTPQRCERDYGGQNHKVVFGKSGSERSGAVCGTGPLGWLLASQTPHGEIPIRRFCENREQHGKDRGHHASVRSSADRYFSMEIILKRFHDVTLSIVTW